LLVIPEPLRNIPQRDQSRVGHPTSRERANAIRTSLHGIGPRQTCHRWIVGRAAYLRLSWGKVRKKRRGGFRERNKTTRENREFNKGVMVSTLKGAPCANPQSTMGSPMGKSQYREKGGFGRSRKLPSVSLTTEPTRSELLGIGGAGQGYWGGLEDRPQVTAGLAEGTGATQTKLRHAIGFT